MIDDNLIIDIFSKIRNDKIGINGKMITAYINKTKAYNFEIYNYVINRFKDCNDFNEAIYRIIYNITETPKCPICGKILKFNKGYNKHCSNKCKANDINVRLKCKQTCLNKYGVENVSQNSNIKEKVKNTFSEKWHGRGAQSEIIKEKMQQTCLERYGCKHNWQNKEIWNKTNETRINKYGSANNIKKANETNLSKYGCTRPSQNQAIKEKTIQSNIKKYGFINHTQRLEYRQFMSQLRQYQIENNLINYKEIFKKQIETKRKNHTFNTSRPEEYIYEKLCEIFTADNVIRQHHTDEYPFDCDFYIIPLNLYIEYQGIWTHNDHPFDETNENDLKIVESWSQKNSKFYNGAIDVWTKRDVLKRNTAKKNNLNWIEFFNLSQFDEWFRQLIT